jgi:signal transduction histidine kinase
VLLAEYSSAQHNFIDSLQNNFHSAANDSARTVALGALVDYYSFNQFDSSMYYSSMLIDLSEKKHNLYGVYLGNFGLFHAYNCKGNYPKALEIDLKMMRVSEQLRQIKPSLLWVGHYFEGVLFREMLDYPNAFFHFREALRLQDSTNVDIGDWFASYSQFALIYKGKKMPDSALFFAKQGYWLATKAQDFKKFICLASRILGSMYELNSEYDSAKRFYHIAIDESIHYNNIYFLTGTYNFLSSYFLKIGNIDSSIYYANKSFLLCTEHNFGDFTYDASTILRDAYKTKRNPDSTLKYMQIMLAEKDSIYNQENIKKFQSYFFNEELNEQQNLANEEKKAQSIRIYYLAAALGFMLLLAFVLYRSNLQKHKANRIISKALDDLKDAQTQLVLQEKMASLGELTAGIAHEIKNPLNFVNNFSDVNTELLEELSTEADKANFHKVKAIAKDVIENSKKINFHGKRADAIVKAMLQHTRQSKGVKEMTDINALCDEYLRLAYHGFRAKEKDFNVKIKTDFHDAIGKINIVPQDIGRVLLNLANNAFYAVNERQKGGGVEYDPAVTISTTRSGNQVFITIRDNGNGIPNNITDKIFQPFFTTKPAGSGTGLGLSLSYDIIKSHGGEIRVETKKGEGTEFNIQLPIN